MEKVKAVIGRRVALTTGTATREPSSPGEEPGSAAGQQSFKRRTVKFTVTDVVYSGMYDLDRDFIYLPITEMSARIYPGEKTQADTIQIKLAEGADVEVAMAVVSGIWRDFAQDRFAWSGYATISTSVEMQARLIGEYKKQLGMLMLIFGVLSGGVVLLISCIFYLIVITKQKDIAIVKSCGLGSGAVAGLFVAFGVTVGLAGSALGFGLGYLITKNINPIERFVSDMMGIKLWKSSTYMFSRIPNQVDTEVAFWVIIAAVSAAAIGALIPAIAAARLKPVEILRFE
jgi:lipoprotein-releasing system permease protein